MGRSSRTVFVGLAVVAIGFAGGCGPDVPGVLTIQTDTAVLEEVIIRDELIAAQQSMLNALRCQFEFETQLVPGGCIDGQPGAGPVQAATFTGVPIRQDLVDRDELIRVQEALLNDYRCRFGIDLHVVPGGCPDEAETADT
ncbi:MAG: hypothetical protein OXH53_08280 [bacterium]|nr:hypothetical protein [bacterium]